jgi:hypothetical protein
LEAIALLNVLLERCRWVEQKERFTLLREHGRRIENLNPGIRLEELAEGHQIERMVGLGNNVGEGLLIDQGSNFSVMAIAGFLIVRNAVQVRQAR